MPRKSKSQMITKETKSITCTSSVNRKVSWISLMKMSFKSIRLLFNPMNDIRSDLRYQLKIASLSIKAAIDKDAIYVVIGSEVSFILIIRITIRKITISHKCYRSKNSFG